MYTHWGTRPKKVYILGPFGRDCIPHLASYILNFWWPPPSLYIFNLLYEMRGGLTESCSTKKNRQISDPVPFIHFELPGRLSGGPTEYYQILHDSHDSTVQYRAVLVKNRALDRALWWSPPCKNLALDPARWCSPPCKNRALNRAVLVFPCVPLRAKIVL